MKIIVNSQLFAHELRLLNKIAPTKPQIQILSHVLLTTESQKVAMYATDLEIGLSTSCPAYVEQQGMIALPAARLLAMFDQFESTDVILSVVEDNQIRITKGSFTSRLQTMPTADFPLPQKVEGTPLTLNAQGLSRLIGCTRYAIPDAPTMYTVQGALLSLTGPHVAMIGTDSRRVALATMSRDIGPDVQTILPRKTMGVLAEYELGDIQMSIGTNHLFFQAEQRLLISRMLEGQFPNYQRIIPRDCDKKAVVQRSSLQAALRRVGLAADVDGATSFAFADKVLTMSAASAQVGDAVEQIAIDYEGEPLTVVAPWKYVLDFLDASSGASVTLQSKDVTGPLLLTDGENHLGVIMTMRK